VGLLSASLVRFHNESLLCGQTQATHFDQVLGDLRYTLLAFMSHEVGPVDKFLVDLGISLLVQCL
jgi:hypothetical protein